MNAIQCPKCGSELRLAYVMGIMQAWYCPKCDVPLKHTHPTELPKA